MTRAAILTGVTLGVGGSLVAASFNSGWYQAVLVVHLAAAVIGFGGSALGSVMLRRAWTAEGLDAAAAVRRAYEFASNRLRKRAELWSMAGNLIIVVAIAVMVTKLGL